MVSQRADVSQGKNGIHLSHIVEVCDELPIVTNHKKIVFMPFPTRFNSNVAKRVLHGTLR